MSLFLLGLLALAACTNGGNCDNCGDDTGAHPVETMSYVQVQVFVPTEDDIVSCHAELSGPKTYAFDTTDENGDPVIIPVLIGDYAVKVGDQKNMTSYGTAIHTATDGSLSIAPADAQANVVAATEAEPQVVAVDNIPYFGGVYSCNTVVFTYDPDTAGHKSGTGRDLGSFTYSVEVQANGKIESADGSEFGVLTLNSYFVVTADNELDVVFSQDDAGMMSISGSQITATSFGATVIDTHFQVVADLLCTK